MRKNQQRLTGPPDAPPDANQLTSFRWWQVLQLRSWRPQHRRSPSYCQPSHSSRLVFPIHCQHQSHRQCLQYLHHPHQLLLRLLVCIAWVHDRTRDNSVAGHVRFKAREGPRKGKMTNRALDFHPILWSLTFTTSVTVEIAISTLYCRRITRLVAFFHLVVFGPTEME